MSGRKDDAGKPPLSLISRHALLAEARVMAKGAEKYGAHNWRRGMDWSRLIDAAMRHILAFADGEDFDTEVGGSGELHLANARCCLGFLIEYYYLHLGSDDRFEKVESQLTQTELDEYRKWSAGASMDWISDAQLKSDSNGDAD